MRSANPALNASTFDRYRTVAPAADNMTLEGTVFRSGFLLALLVASAIWPWTLFSRGAAPGALVGYLLVGLVGGAVVAMVCVFKPTTAPVTAPLYALLDGLALLGEIEREIEQAIGKERMRALHDTLARIDAHLDHEEQDARAAPRARTRRTE